MGFVFSKIGMAARAFPSEMHCKSAFSVQECHKGKIVCQCFLVLFTGPGAEVGNQCGALDTAGEHPIYCSGHIASSSLI